MVGQGHPLGVLIRSGRACGRWGPLNSAGKASWSFVRCWFHERIVPLRPEPLLETRNMKGARCASKMNHCFACSSNPSQHRLASGHAFALAVNLRPREQKPALSYLRRVCGAHTLLCLVQSDASDIIEVCFWCKKSKRTGAPARLLNSPSTWASRTHARWRPFRAGHVSGTCLSRYAELRPRRRTRQAATIWRTSAQ